MTLRPAHQQSGEYDTIQSQLKPPGTSNRDKLTRGMGCMCHRTISKSKRNSMELRLLDRPLQRIANQQRNLLSEPHRQSCQHVAALVRTRWRTVVGAARAKIPPHFVA